MISVILLEKVKKLGNLGESVSVKPGFARNYLVPKGKALPATKQNLAAFKEKRDALEQAYKDQLDMAKQRAETLLSLTPIQIQAKAGEEGKLFGSITTRNLTDHLIGLGFKCEKTEFVISGKVLRSVGEHTLTFTPNAEVSVDIVVNVVADH